MGKKSCDELNELEKLRCDFWDTLRRHLLEAQSPLQPGKSDDGFWLLFTLGVTDNSEARGQNVRIVWVEGSKAKKIEDCSFYHVEDVYYGHPLPPLKPDPAMSRQWFKFMCECRQNVHDALGFELDWDNHAKIDVYLKSRRVIADIRDRNAWPGYINDMRIQAERLHTVFQPHALAFNEAYLDG